MISDQRWGDIVAAALPYRPNDAARAALDTALVEFAGLRRDPAAIRRERERWQRIGEALAPLHGEMMQLYLDGGTPQERSSLLGLLFALEEFAVRADNKRRGLALWAEAYRRQADPARDWLFWQLFEIWTRDFGGKLTVSTTDEPVGPLIRFLQVTTPLALGTSPSPHTFKDAVTREQQRRAVDQRMRKRLLGGPTSKNST